VIGAALLIATPSSWINSHILASSPARFVGRISYSWYLWHWPLLALLRFYSGDTPQPKSIAFTIAVSFGFAVVSYYVVEQPFRKRSQPAKPAVICLIIATSGIFVWMLRGIPQRFPLLAGLSKEQIRMQADPCLVEGDKPNFSSQCYAITGTHPAVTMWGDSHGAALSPSLRDYVTDRGYEFAQLTKAGVDPMQFAP
jgi:SGNH domain-containing protein